MKIAITLLFGVLVACGAGCSTVSSQIPPTAITSAASPSVTSPVASVKPPSGDILEGTVNGQNIYLHREDAEESIVQQTTYLVDASGTDYEILAGDLEQYSGMNHMPNEFSVLNHRDTAEDTMKKVGVKFSVSVENGVANPAKPNLYSYRLHFQLPQSGYGSLGEFTIMGPATSTNNLIELRGSETLEHPGQDWLKIGDTMFVFDEKTKKIREESTR